MKIKEAINMIIWKYKDRKEDFQLVIRDRFVNEVEIPFKDIQRVDNNYIYLYNETIIPLHRVLRIKKGNITIWRRYST
ncbi:DUF504 domain-containing protein [Acidianus manzaensis]|uniref:UPF0248 protein B6F84_01540 n=1 Tax=Acidianus manzaensis TaxID=282676 RepID=A0A1W6JX24_9CREN|nr:RNA repair domain-containing protein [Acidianus manzaensis]ARM74836.1 hypothetical protein B6F84_01540 [Acidianus manzaensis]